MNLRTIATRAAVAGVSTALAAGAVVGITTTSANAASTAGDYSCTALGSPLGTFPLTLDVPLLPPTAVAGFPIPRDLLSYTSTITVPAGAAALLESQNVDGGTTDDFTLTVGSEVVQGPGTYTANEPSQDGSVVMDGEGANKKFVLPEAGTHDINLPASFTFTPTSEGNPLPVPVTCSTDAPAKLGSITLSKQVTQTKATAPKPVKKNKQAAVPVKVTNEYADEGGAPVTGKVTAKEGKKALGTAAIKNGKAIIKLAKLKPGTHKIVISYGGDKFNAGSKTQAIKVVVKK